jgi:hypothetical protein
MRIINSDEATIDDAFEIAQLMIEEGNTEQGVQLLRAAEIAVVRLEVAASGFVTPTRP